MGWDEIINDVRSLGGFINQYTGAGDWFTTALTALMALTVAVKLVRFYSWARKTFGTGEVCRAALAMIRTLPIDAADAPKVNFGDLAVNLDGKGTVIALDNVEVEPHELSRWERKRVLAAAAAAHEKYLADGRAKAKKRKVRKMHAALAKSDEADEADEKEIEQEMQKTEFEPELSGEQDADRRAEKERAERNGRKQCAGR